MAADAGGENYFTLMERLTSNLLAIFFAVNMNSLLSQLHFYRCTLCANVAECSVISVSSNVLAEELLQVKVGNLAVSSIIVLVVIGYILCITYLRYFLLEHLRGIRQE